MTSTEDYRVNRRQRPIATEVCNPKEIKLRLQRAETIRIKQIIEPDIDNIIVAPGGRRLESEDSADYELGEALIELKLVTEEGFEKESRQTKLAELFSRTASINL